MSWPRRILLAWVAAFLAASSTANAQEIAQISYSDLLQRLEQLEQRQAALERVPSTTFASYQGGCGVPGCDGGGCDGCGCDGCGSCGCGGCSCYCSGVCGWIFGFEAVIAKPYFTDEIDAANEPSYDYDFSPRFWLGYRTCNGLGVRGRYWDADWQSDVQPAFAPPPTPLSLSLKAADVEATQLVCTGPIILDFFGGVRYGRAEHRAADDIDGTMFEGFGPTVGLEGIIPLGCSGTWALVGNFRASYLYGDTSVVDFGVTSKGDDDFTSVYEVQVGAEWSRCVGYGTLSARAMLEAQNWGSAVLDPSTLTNGAGNELGLLGGVLRLQYVY